MNQHNFHKLISGQNASLTATLLRYFLGAAAIGYSLVVRLRNSLYSKSWLKVYTADVQVFSIGNITTGGTGKTPLDSVVPVGPIRIRLQGKAAKRVTWYAPGTESIPLESGFRAGYTETIIPRLEAYGLVFLEE